MPGRHQHGTTNKNLGITISRMPRDPITEGHQYMFKVHEGTNRQCIFTKDSVSASQLEAFILQYGPRGLGMEVHWIDRSHYPWFENAI